MRAYSLADLPERTVRASTQREWIVTAGRTAEPHILLEQKHPPAFRGEAWHFRCFSSSTHTADFLIALPFPSESKLLALSVLYKKINYW